MGSAIIGSITGSSMVIFVLFLLKKSLETRLTYSVKHEYDRLLEEFKQQQEVRIKSEVVAELLAEWIKSEPDHDRLNHLSFQLYLWLPEDIYLALSEVLTHTSNSENLRSILYNVRVHLLGECDRLKPHNVVVFPKVNKASN